MVFTWFVNLFINFFNFLLGYLPDADSTAINLMHDGLYNYKAILASANWILPIDTFYFMLNFIIRFILLIAFIRLTLFIASILSGGIIKK
jgi:hypothetical protein